MEIRIREVRRDANTVGAMKILDEFTKEAAKSVGTALWAYDGYRLKAGQSFGVAHVGDAFTSALGTEIERRIARSRDGRNS